MKEDLFAKRPSSHPRLALRPKEAAESLGISERLLWDWTHNHGLPHVRIGRVIAYPIEGIRGWLYERSQKADADHLDNALNSEAMPYNPQPR